MRSSCAFEWMATSGIIARDEELHVVAVSVYVDESVARVEQRVHVGDVDVAVEVRLEERGHRDLAAGMTGGELLVVEDDEIGQLGHVVFLFSLPLLITGRRRLCNTRRSEDEPRGRPSRNLGSAHRSEKETVC